MLCSLWSTLSISSAVSMCSFLLATCWAYLQLVLLCRGRSTSHTIDVQSLLLLLQTVFSADTYTRSFMQMPKLTGTFHSPLGPSPHSTCCEFCRLMTRHSLYPCSVAFGVWILQQQMLSNWGCTCYGAHATQKANNSLPSMFCNTAHHTCRVIRRCWLQGILLLS